MYFVLWLQVIYVSHRSQPMLSVKDDEVAQGAYVCVIRQVFIRSKHNVAEEQKGCVKRKSFCLERLDVTDAIDIQGALDFGVHWYQNCHIRDSRGVSHHRFHDYVVITLLLSRN
jgi:hypothetical protein